jgi:hypothetical protein
MVPSRRVSTLRGCCYAVVEGLPLRPMGRLLPRTSENSSSRTFVNKGKEEGPGRNTPALCGDIPQLLGQSYTLAQIACAMAV